jgi:hypothetical protein
MHYLYSAYATGYLAIRVHVRVLLLNLLPWIKVCNDKSIEFTLKQEYRFQSKSTMKHLTHILYDLVLLIVRSRARVMLRILISHELPIYTESV